MSINTVVGTFANRDDADMGMTRLLMVGFQPRQIRILITAEVTDTEGGTVAAAVMHDSNAIEVASPVPMRHPVSSEEAA